MILFDPALAQLFSSLYSDPVWLIFLMFALAYFIMAFVEDQIRWSRIFLALLFFSLTFLTRTTLVPLFMSILGFAALALGLLVAKYRSPRFERSLHSLMFSTGFLILGLSLINIGACRYNLHQHGYLGLNYFDCRETKSLLFCLGSVGEPTGQPYFPVDADRRKLIATAGPACASFIRQLEANNFYKQVGMEHFGVSDIPTGWLHWAIFSASVRDGDYLPAFASFRDMEKEIDLGQREGRLKVRPVLELPDSRVTIVAGVLPAGFRHVLQQIIFEPSPAAFAWKKNLFVDVDFTHFLHRRSPQPSPVREKAWHILLHAYGWLYTPFLFFVLGGALSAFVTVICYHWKEIGSFPFYFLSQQLVLVTFLVFIFWYALFDASGVPVLDRYVIFQHVFLPILSAYYLSQSWRLFQHRSLMLL